MREYSRPSSRFESALTDDACESRFESGLTRYQTRLDLPVTSNLDTLTLSEITTPRCGASDSIIVNRTGTVQRFAFFPGEPRWVPSCQLTLTYAIAPTDTVDHIPRAEVAVAAAAFRRWAMVIPARFKKTAEDVKVGSHSGDHGDGEPFDGALVHAFSLESGQLHLDTARRWAVGGGLRGRGLWSFN